MIVSTTESVPGREVVEILGLVTGNIVLVLSGGNVVGVYMEMLAEARAKATRLMIGDAEQLNADAVLNVRYTTSVISQAMSEILAYGTAVKLR